MFIEMLENRRLLSSVTLRIASYNIEDDIDGYTTPRPGLSTVLEGIGAETIGGTAKSIDVLALEETTSNSTTVAPIVTALNSYYGSGTYAISSYQATEVDGDAGDGNGPNALVYDTKTVTLLASVGVGTPDGTNGEYRQVVRYEFQPVGAPAASDFYVYVSHYKSGTGTSNDNLRNGEAQIIRADEATLPSSVRVLYVGDFNDSVVAAPAYQTLVASGKGQAFDPANPTNSDPGTSPAAALLTEAATALDYRDDYQMMTGNVLNDTSGGLAYVSGSLQGFGNNGSVAAGGNLDSASNTALPGLANRSAVLEALTTASDHLPVVADFTDPLTTTATTGSVSGSIKTSSGTGIANVTVYLDANNNSKLDSGELSTTTSSTGTFSFASVPTGAYIVRQILPSGDTQTSPSAGYGNHITVTAGGALTNENFVDAAGGGSVSGSVKLSSGTGISGITVYLDANNNSKLDSGELSTTTSSTGTYSFSNVPTGAYIVRQLLPTGDAQTSPSDGYGDHITVASGSSLSNENFIDAGTASVTGTVFNDSNGNGKKDTGEVGLSDLTLYLDLNNSGAYVAGDPTVSTDSTGDYDFTGLFAGTYIVRVERPSGYTQTTPADNYGIHITLAAGQKSTGNLFGEKAIT